MKRSTNNSEVKKLNRNRVFRYINDRDETCMPEISARDAYYLKRFERMFAWDNKLVDLDYIAAGYGNNLKMLVIQYSDNKKANIYRF